MSYAPELKNEAFQLYLLGQNAQQIAKELKRRHAGDGQQTPSAKTVEKWAYVPVAGKTWSERRYEAEAAAQAAATKDFVSAKTRLMSGMLRIQSKLQERTERALDNAEDAEPENLTQEVYALANVTKSVERMLENQLAEEARRKDQIDCLIEAVRRVVPNFEDLQPHILAEFRKLSQASGA